MIVIGLVSIFIFIIIFDLNTVLKNQNSKTYLCYFGILVIGFIINLLLVIDKAPPSPVILIEKIVKFII